MMRQAAAHDAERLAQLAQQLGYAVSAEDVRRYLVELGDGHAVWVALDAAACVQAWMHLRLQRQLHQAPYVEIVALVVDQAARSQGLGQALLQQAQTWAHSVGAPELRLYSNLKRERAHRFYVRAGFAQEKQSAHFVRRAPHAA
ncbi:GNAT family N-acetyltransferase [Massilia sp. W12]|uniref:GNAT family N-acetyltransferase n=1 Tax=Massilia sp. W12 TaxID=3126507 RepID=UPI0030CBC736